MQGKDVEQDENNLCLKVAEISILVYVSSKQSDKIKNHRKEVEGSAHTLCFAQL